MKPSEYVRNQSHIHHHPICPRLFHSLFWLFFYKVLTSPSSQISFPVTSKLPIIAQRPSVPDHLDEYSIVSHAIFRRVFKSLIKIKYSEMQISDNLISPKNTKFRKRKSRWASSTNYTKFSIFEISTYIQQTTSLWNISYNSRKQIF